VLNPRAAIRRPVPGQVVAVPNVGAYGLTASVVGFLSRALPREVVLDPAGAVLSVTELELRRTEHRAATP
jgi:hypothetical protein